MIKWSRVKLALSILTATGLWQTLIERFAVAPSNKIPSNSSNKPRCRFYDYAGAVHVHSTYSDGTGTVEQIVDAAIDARLDFVILSDHSSLQATINLEDGWRGGNRLLLVVGTEITTDNGHILALNIPPDFDVESTSAQSLMERIREAGGYGYIALPCDLKDHWRDFNIREDEFGIEVFNLSAVARTKINIPGFLITLARYFSRSPLTAFSLVASRATTELETWDRLSLHAHIKGKPIPNAIGSLDAHAVMRFGGRDYPYPTYQQVFRTLRTHVLLNHPLSHENGQTAQDFKLIHDALRNGQSYISYDNFGDPEGFSFRVADDKGCHAQMGDTVILDERKNISFEAFSPQRRSIFHLYRNGKIIATSRGSKLSYPITQSGVYRVEALMYRYRLGDLCFSVHPWIFSNWIEVVRE